MRKKRGTICPDGTVSDDCSDRKRREVDVEECDDDKYKTHPSCLRRKRHSPAECEKEGDPNCTRRKRRSSSDQHCADNDLECNDRERKRRESCLACEKNPDSTECSEC